MKNKNILALIMAVLMTAMVSPAYASGDNGKFQTVIEADCKLPDVVVTLPTTGQIYLNPYKLPVEIDGENTTEQIVSTPASIENESDVPLNVSVTIKATINEGSDMVMGTASTQGTSLTSKKAFIYFEMKATSDPDNVAWESGYDSEQHLIVRTTAKTKKNIVTLDQADQPNHYGAFRLTGDCVAVPRRSPWTETDGLDVEIVFTFTPLMRKSA